MVDPNSGPGPNVPEADYAEQQLPVSMDDQQEPEPLTEPSQGGIVAEPSSLREVNEADRLEQAMPVTDRGEEDYPHLRQEQDEFPALSDDQG